MHRYNSPEFLPYFPVRVRVGFTHQRDLCWTGVLLLVQISVITLDVGQGIHLSFSGVRDVQTSQESLVEHLVNARHVVSASRIYVEVPPTGRTGTGDDQSDIVEGSLYPWNCNEGDQ